MNHVTVASPRGRMLAAMSIPSAFADLLICDSQTMAAEAAVLGTPSLRMNSFVNKITYLKLLETKFDLTYGFTPDAQNELLVRLDELRARDNLKDEWLKRRDRMLGDWSDPTDVFWRELQAQLDRTPWPS